MSVRAVRALLSGHVQGCGVRPALARLAVRQSWSGTVRNTTAGVELRLCGALPANETLAQLIADSLPFSCDRNRLLLSDVVDFTATGFCIEPSELSGSPTTVMPQDLAICAECLAESRERGNRRYRYPFTSCATCGPRYSISFAIPFDRERTTMREFPLCDDCRCEYENPLDRRFHAQTICCATCGPRVWFENRCHEQISDCEDAICHAADAIRRGEIVALRGIGGYQLLADATNRDAVRELRRRKRRLAKPFAVMCADLNQARAFAQMNQMEESVLCSAQNPIVIARKQIGSGLADAVNPELRDIGLFLPTTALHDQLMGRIGRPIVCTSGNIDGEPLACQVDDARNRLSDIADGFLHHDREIHHPIDDSVVRVIRDRAVTIRSGRGFAPAPLPLCCDRKILAVGGQQKSTIAVSNGFMSWISPHIGDLDSVASQDEWLRRLDIELENEVLQVDGVAYDPHPDYFVTQAATSMNAERYPVWHHHAHVVAGMLQQGWLDRTVLGVAFDGTGLGPDGTIWGGEFLLATATTFRRVGHLRAISLPPGEAASGDLRSLALSYLSQLVELTPNDQAELLKMSHKDVQLRRQALTTNWSICSSSCGRLFDALGCLILGQRHAQYEGQPALMLESACELGEPGAYEFAEADSTVCELDWRPLLRQVLVDLRTNISPGRIAMKFHRALANGIISICLRWPDLPVVLGGGVFQNRILTELICEIWPHQAPLGLPGRIPPNDGGLAAGQLACLQEMFKAKGQPECALVCPEESASGLIATH